MHNRLLFKPAITDLFCFLGTIWQWKRTVNTTLTILSPYKADMMNVLANSCLFTHSPDTEQHKPPLRVMFVCT